MSTPSSLHPDSTQFGLQISAVFIMSRAYLILACLVAAAACAMAQPPNGILVTVQFDNQLKRVQSNINVVNKYMAEKLCRVKPAAQMALKGLDQSTTLNHKSTVQFFCFGTDVKTLLSNCNGMWNRHQFNDEIGDHTMPDIEVQKVTCEAKYMARGH